MGRNINSSILSKEYVLDKVSQISIFATYLGLSESVIKNCILTGELICSPLREDVHPTCGFRYNNKGQLKFRDFAGYFWGDCFDVVAYVMTHMYNKTYDVSNKHDFIKILRHIMLTFIDIFYGKEKDIELINSINKNIETIKHEKPIIELVVRNWEDTDIKYWRQFGINLSILNNNFIYPVEQYYINRTINPEPKYYYKPSDPCYAYLLGIDRNNVYSIKLYFPCREKCATKFITNCNHLEGIYNLERNNYQIIIITKSTKDRLSLVSAISSIPSLYGGLDKNRIGCINIPNEVYHLKQNEYDWLKSKLSDNGIIVSLMDNDRTGMLEALWLRRMYDIYPYIIDKKYGVKDFAEYRANYGKKETVEKLTEILNGIT